MARFWGVNERTVAGWKAAGMPGRNGQYDLARIAKWQVERAQRQRDAPPVDKNGVPIDPAQREKYWKARLAELELRKRQGEMVPRREHEHALLERSGWFCQAFDHQAGHLGPLLANKPRRVCAKMLRDYAREIRRKAFGEQEE